MLCRKPFVKKGAQFGCGQCMHCRYNRRRIWTHRIMLEALVHAKASFVTLTYSDEHIPALGSVVPGHMTLFLKRYRQILERRCDFVGGIRYFLVGEYGDQTERPHYHLAIFGADGREAYLNSDGRCVSAINQAWQFGFSYVGELTFDSAAYIAGYVTKKMTGKNDERLVGRYPEFARMSLKPGIGALSVDQISSVVSHPLFEPELRRTGDVPGSLRHGHREMPLGRYLRGKLRDACGVTANDTGVDVWKKSAEMLLMYERFFTGASDKSPFQETQEKLEQRRLNREARFKLYSAGKKL